LHTRVSTICDIKREKNGVCAVKLDMTKAYDRVEWNYLHAVLGALGFSERWQNLVMKCVTSVSFSVQINGMFSPTFKPTSGIRQGDPISPYLFVLCAEGLTSMLKFCGPQHLAKGIRVGIHAPWISHLLFADDSLIFMQANTRGASRLANILELYHRGSGQLVNNAKTAVFFSANCDQNMKQAVCCSLQIQTEALGERYLGLPTAVGKVSDGTFDYSADRIRSFVHGWGENNMSCTGREVLLKANAQAVPTIR